MNWSPESEQVSLRVFLKFILKYFTFTKKKKRVKKTAMSTHEATMHFIISRLGP